MIQDEIKNEFLILSPSQSYDGSIMINNNQKETQFQVGKRINISHPRQPNFEIEEDKTPAFEIFDLKAHKQNTGIIWQFRRQTQQTNAKLNITEVNTFQKNQKKVLIFIEKLKQNFTLKQKQYKIINQLLFSPLNIGKTLYNNSLQPLISTIWSSIMFLFCSILLTVSPIEYIYQQNGYLNYLFAIMIILVILDQIYKYTSQSVENVELDNSQLFLEYILKSKSIIMDTSCIVSLVVLILSDNEFIRTIGLFLIKFLIFKKLILTFNKKFYYELSDLSIQTIQILLTCHFITCIYLRQEFIINQDIKQAQDLICEYFDVYIYQILQFGNFKFNIGDDKILNQAFYSCTQLILLIQKIQIFRLIILDSLDLFQDYKKIKDLKLLQQFLRKQKVPQQIKDQISQKLDQIFLKNNNQGNIENYFEQCLEKELIFQEFKEEKLFNFVSQFKIFSKFSKSTKQLIAQNLSPIILNKNDKFICNHFGDQYNVYLLYQGKVVRGLSEKIQEYHKIFHGQCFGQYSFFTGQEDRNQIKCLDYCLIYKLSRDKFLQIISSNIQDLEIATFIKDQILFNNNYQIIDSACLYCQEKNHLIINCPKIHLIKNNINFYDKYLYSPNQIRKPYNRRRKECECSKNHFKKLNDTQMNNVQIEESLSDFNQQSLSNMESNIEKKFQGESCNNLLVEINNENMIQNGQNDQQYKDIISSNSYQQPQQKLQTKSIFEMRISNIINRPNSQNLLPSLSSYTSPIKKLQTPSLPTVTEFLNFVSDNPYMENIYKIDLDRLQDFQIYYPEYNIIPVLFKAKRNHRKSLEEKSQLTINQSDAFMIRKIIQKSEKIVKI